jgi:aromatic ring-opening dioxygenase catalytic subunit (LigB family)
MNIKPSDQSSPVLFIPHGGGPLPLLGDASHQAMVDFLSAITASFGEPSAILVISAHWEEGVATITSGKSPSLIYDYYGFPDAAYDVEYPAAGDPILAERIFGLLEKAGIEARMDDQRGFDHGLFVPLKLMYPAANIPCVQLSLVNDLDPETHINLGKALSDLRKENVLIVGSGLSFHNMGAFLSQTEVTDAKNEAFEDWLVDTCSNNNVPPQERERRLIEWADAPAARYCHPREEHLLPLHVCCGLSNSAAALVFDDKVIGKRTTAYLW